MTSRDFLWARDGSLRAVWRIGGFLLLSVSMIGVLGRVVFLIARPGGELAQILWSSWAYVVALLASHAVMLRWVDKLPWSAAGLGAHEARGGALAHGWILGALAIGIPCATLLVAGWLRAVPTAGAGDEWWRFALLMAVVLAPAALWEELVFRGYVFATLRRSTGSRAALAITSVLFGLLHWANPGAGVRPLVLVMLAGLFLGAVVMVTGSVWAAWIAHFAWNWVMAAILHTDVSGALLGMPPGYRVIETGPDWITGGAWGPEGGAAAGVGVAGAIGYLYARARRGQRAEAA
ncbi:MAG: type II CAAX endopeptidase family protein [Gemmatimonadaceae bacterium]